MKRRSDEYLIEENPMKALLILALPMILGSLFQQVYNMVDSIIVGRYVGQNALAAVGASAALTNVFICVAVGAGVGVSVLVGQTFGARAYGKMRQAVSTAMIFFLLLSILLGIFGIIFSRSIMVLLNTPEETLDMAVTYLKVYFWGFPFLFMYNILSSMFNAIGKSRIPLYFLIASSVLNIILDLYMVVSLGMGVFGAALATLIAQGISAVISFFVFRKEMKRYPGTFRWFSASELGRILSLAVPSVIQQSTVSIGMMLVQSVVNSFGAEALAGFSAASRIESICAIIFISIGNAVSPYVSQNYGAGKKERIPKGYHAGLILDAVFALLLLVTCQRFYMQFLDLFLGSDGTAAAYEAGAGYLRYLSLFFVMMGIKMTTDGVLRGMGKMNVFMIANIANLLFRVLSASILAPRFGIFFVWGPVPIGWTINFLISYIAGYRVMFPKHEKPARTV